MASVRFGPTRSLGPLRPCSRFGSYVTLNVFYPPSPNPLRGRPTGNPPLAPSQEIDPILEPILAKSFIKRGNQTLIKLGDKEVDYSPDFRLYLTTKLANPLYTPEISTKVMIVNFAVKEQGLEAQLLATVVKNERPDLDKQKNDLVVKVAAGKRTQAELEDTILHLLSTATGSLLDNVTLINTLDQSKTTWEEVNASLLVGLELVVLLRS
jgi:dynein heavy chain